MGREQGSASRGAGEIRTHTGTDLNCVPLPLGYDPSGHIVRARRVEWVDEPVSRGEIEQRLLLPRRLPARQLGRFLLAMAGACGRLRVTIRAQEAEVVPPVVALIAVEMFDPKRQRTAEPGTSHRAAGAAV